MKWLRNENDFEVTRLPYTYTTTYSDKNYYKRAAFPFTPLFPHKGYPSRNGSFRKRQPPKRKRQTAA